MLENLRTSVEPYGGDLFLLMAVLATAGGVAGARLAKRLPTAWVRAIVIVTGLVMSALFFARSG